MEDIFFEGRLRRTRGEPKIQDLSAYLPGGGSWKLSGWKLASTDEVEIYYSPERSTFVLIVIKLGGQPYRAWHKNELRETVATASDFLTPLDRSRLQFVLSPFMPAIQ